VNNPYAPANNIGSDQPKRLREGPIKKAKPKDVGLKKQPINYFEQAE
jgi:hypothetical protein